MTVSEKLKLEIKLLDDGYLIISHQGGPVDIYINDDDKFLDNIAKRFAELAQEIRNKKKLDQL